MCAGNICWHLYYLQTHIIVSCGTLHEPRLTNWKCVFYSPIGINGTTQTIKHEECRLKGGEDEKIFLSAKEKEGDLVQKEAHNAQVQVDYICRALFYHIQIKCVAISSTSCKMKLIQRLKMRIY
jgi:hypothetical protein